VNYLSTYDSFLKNYETEVIKIVEMVRGRLITIEDAMKLGKIRYEQLVKEYESGVRC
jgi:hypothetical protein